VRRDTPRGRTLLHALHRHAVRPRRSAALRARARELYRHAILAAAERIFARSGFTGTRMADVAAEAGLATGTLYNYFANRDALLSSLIERRSEELLAAVRTAAEGAGADEPRAILLSMLRTSFQYLEAHRALFAALQGATGISGRQMASINRRCVESQRSYHAIIADVLGRAIRAGRVRADVPTSVLVDFLTGAAHGVMRAWMARNAGAAGAEQPLVDRAADVVDLFLRGASVPS